MADNADLMRLILPAIGQLVEAGRECNPDRVRMQAERLAGLLEQAGQPNAAKEVRRRAGI